MEFKLNEYHRNISDDNLIQDVKEVAKSRQKNTVTMAEYKEYGKYNPVTLTRRFGSWFDVLSRAGMQQSRSKYNISNEELFENLKNVWITLERQPKAKDLKKPLSKHGCTTYIRKFGSFRKSLEAFIEYINVMLP